MCVRESEVVGPVEVIALDFFKTDFHEIGSIYAISIEQYHSDSIIYITFQQHCQMLSPHFTFKTNCNTHQVYKNRTIQNTDIHNPSYYYHIITYVFSSLYPYRHSVSSPLFFINAVILSARYVLMLPPSLFSFGVAYLNKASISTMIIKIV